MNTFKTQYHKIQQDLLYEEYNKVLKRIIDLTLDTEDIVFYKKTSELLTWVDYNKSNIQEVKEKYTDLLSELYIFLENKKEKDQGELLKATGLKKAYSQSAFALGPVDLTISSGEIIGLVGENGNGKTTLLRSLCGELQPTEGEITYNFKYKDQYDLRTRLVYIPQRTNTWKGSTLDNLQFTAASYGVTGKANQYITDLVLTRMGLREYKNLAWKNLSSGYKMRFELARMLLRKPKLLLIDEPLANLDILAQQVVLDDFIDIAKSPFRPIGIVLSSQQLYEVEKTADQIVFLKRGVQQNLKTKEGEEMPSYFTIEFESDNEQEKLRQYFSELKLISLQYTGGTYIAVFPEEITRENFLQTIINKEISLKYFRDISNSTRRFFI